MDIIAFFMSKGLQNQISSLFINMQRLIISCQKKRLITSAGIRLVQQTLCDSNESEDATDRSYMSECFVVLYICNGRGETQRCRSRTCFSIDNIVFDVSWVGEWGFGFFPYLWCVGLLHIQFLLNSLQLLPTSVTGYSHFIAPSSLRLLTHTHVYTHAHLCV